MHDPYSQSVKPSPALAGRAQAVKNLARAWSFFSGAMYTKSYRAANIVKPPPPQVAKAAAPSAATSKAGPRFRSPPPVSRPPVRPVPPKELTIALDWHGVLDVHQQGPYLRLLFCFVASPNSWGLCVGGWGVRLTLGSTGSKGSKGTANPGNQSFVASKDQLSSA